MPFSPVESVPFSMFIDTLTELSPQEAPRDRARFTNEPDVSAKSPTTHAVCSLAVPLLFQISLDRTPNRPGQGKTDQGET